MLQTEIVDDNDVTVHGGDDHSVAEAGDAHAHQSVCAEDVAVIVARLGVLVDVPEKDGSVQARGDPAGFFPTELDIFHPVRVSSKGADSTFQVPRVPESNRRVVGAGRK